MVDPYSGSVDCASEAEPEADLYYIDTDPDLYSDEEY
jgi:hypothetical protein